MNDYGLFAHCVSHFLLFCLPEYFYSFLSLFLNVVPLNLFLSCCFSTYINVYNFLNHLILQCPEKNFKMTRYYGFYSNKCRPLLEKIYELYGKKAKRRKIKISQERKKLLKKKLDDLKYRCHMIQSYCKDPILCSCGEVMKPSGQYNPFEGGKKNDRRYRNRSIRGMGQLKRY